MLNENTSGYPLTKSDPYFDLRLVDLASASFQLIFINVIFIGDIWRPTFYYV